VTEADDGGTTIKTPFGEEVDRREAHLDALPGKLYHEWFESLNRASKVFSGNTSELEKHLNKFVGTPMFVNELPDNFGVRDVQQIKSKRPPKGAPSLTAGQLRDLLVRLRASEYCREHDLADPFTILVATEAQALRTAGAEMG
jgi:hypothetical protein